MINLAKKKKKKNDYYCYYETSAIDEKWNCKRTNDTNWNNVTGDIQIQKLR